MDVFSAGLTDLAGRRAVYSPNRTAFIDFQDGRRYEYSFRDIDDRAGNLAAWLYDLGVRARDRVAILADNGIEHLDCCFACWKIGAIHVPLNWRVKAGELQHFLQLTSPKVVFVHENSRELFNEAVEPGKLSGKVQTFIVCDAGGCEYDSIVSAPCTLKLPSTSDMTLGDTAILLHTGGTTGLPKAARISHQNIAWNTLNTVIHDLRGDDKFLNVLPLFHTGGLLVYTVPLFILGGTTVLSRQFDADVTLKMFKEEKITVFLSVPTVYRMLMESTGWESADLGSLRFCTSGGAPLPLDLVRRYEKEKGVCFKQGFGMTEFGPGVFALSPADAHCKAGSIGRPNFYVQARIIDKDKECREDQAGELCLKGPSCSPGYFGGSEEVAVMNDTDGWFHTGDVAHRDQEGFYYIIGRKKDLYISGGENVYPIEIERVAQDYPGVRYCAAVGLADEKWGEAGHLAVVLEEGITDFDNEDILEFLKERLARYKIPKQVHILQEMPMTTAGKILKRELQEILKAGAGHGKS